MSRTAVRRARRVLGLAGLALLVAACVPVTQPPPPPPPPPQPYPQWCAANPPGANPDALQSDFESLRLTYTEWASADGAIPIHLPDGRIVWMFGDTYVGRVGADGSIDPNTPIVHNSFVVQTPDGCFAPLMGGAPLARASLIPDPSPNDWYWPASGFVQGGVLRVFMWHMQSTGSDLGFAAVDMQMATFSLSPLSLQSITALPFPTGATRPYGATAMTAAGNAYLYGGNDGNVFVATAPLGQLTVPTAWQFWNGTTFQADPAQAQPMAWSGVPVPPFLHPSGSGPLAQPWVLPVSDGTRFFATAKSADGFSSDVSVFTAPNPQGPWTTDPNWAADTSAPNVAAYGAFTRFTNGANPMIVYSVNTSFANPAPPLSIYNYGPKFVAPAIPLPPPAP